MKKIRLFALAGVLGLVALTGAEGSGIQPVETYCMCACPDGTVICVASADGDCAAPCAQAMHHCPSDS